MVSSESEFDSDSSVSSDNDDTEWKPSDEEHEPLPTPAVGDSSSDNVDSVVQAINAVKDQRLNHPPNIEFQNYAMDLSFHPDQELLAVSSITGDVFM